MDKTNWALMGGLIETKGYSFEFDIEALKRSYQWTEPTLAYPEGHPSGQVLTEAQLEQWREQGFCLVDGLIPLDLVEQERKDLADKLPAPTSVQQGDEFAKVQEFGSGDLLEFPSESDAVNRISFHPRLLAAVARLLDCPQHQLRLTQSVPWGKYGSSCIRDEQFNQDQRMHMDFGNNTLVFPPSWYQPEAVAAILYLSDVEDTLGPTAVVPRESDSDPAYQADKMLFMGGLAGLKFMNNRADFEGYVQTEHPEIFQFRQGLYPREKKARFKPGSLLLYRHDIWHRGTPVAPGTIRFVHNFVFKKADLEHVCNWNTGWTKNMYRPGYPLERWLAKASVLEKTLIGFPPPGHKYWTPYTLTGVQRRWGPYGMDLKPYEEAMQKE